MEKDFIKATKEWYEYVSKDHHKDCDCHWSIHKVERFSYGDGNPKEYWTIEHDGYILDDIYFMGKSRNEVMADAVVYIRNFILENK